MLGRIIDEVAADFTSVEIRQHVVAGNAAQELIKWSEHAEFVVVGAKGHGGFTGMLMGLSQPARARAQRLHRRHGALTPQP